ncbi:RecB family exonuclease [Aquipuribacter hungaricus]|uniref:RecB family exonuclease n=1 Tax=Aquipuribacter hungaricus TaxID=545624 RepID=A0ABV7WCU0_9MICO
MTGTTTAVPLAAPVVRQGSLSPTRAADFKLCPLMYRFRQVDRLPQQPSSAAVRGTVVHRALEQLFDVPAERRTLEHARSLLAPALAEVVAARPEVASLFAAPAAPDAPGGVVAQDAVPSAAAAPDGPDTVPAPVAATPQGEDEARWLAEAERLVGRWFELEDPTRLEPDGREVFVEHQVSEELVLRGIVDRVDVAPDGRIRIVDYKTGRAPSEAFEQRALFQMKFYALLLWRTRGRVPSRVQLVYVGGQGQTLPLDVDEAQLLAFERTLLQLWRAIRTAAETGDWRPNPGRVCRWCDHAALCPTTGGTPPPLPEDALDRVMRPVQPDLPGDDEG